MAEPTNDFSFDPYQVEEQSLNERLKQAMLKQLRQRPDNSDLVGGFNASWDRVQGAKDEQDVYKRRKEMSDSYERSLTDATSNMGPDVANLLRSPATRSIGLDEVKARQKQKRDMDTLRELDAYGGGAPGGAGAATGDKPSLRQVESLMRHPDPGFQSQGKALYELYYKPQDPTHTTARDRSGAMSTIPGAVGALAERDAASAGARAAAEYPYKDELVDFPDGRGGFIKMPKSMALQLQGGGPKSVQALPSAVGAGGIPAPSPVESPATGATGPVNALPAVAARTGGAVPSLDVFKALERSGPNAVSPKGARGEWQVMPQNFRPGEDPNNPAHQQAAAQRVIEDARRLYGDNQEAIVAYYNGGKAAGDAVAAGRAPPAKETQDYLARFRAMSPIGSAQAGAPPPRPDQAIPPPEPRLAPRQGALGTWNPMEEDLRKKQVETNQAAVTDWQGKLRDLPNTKKILDTIEGIGGNVYGGPYGKEVAGVESAFKNTFPGLGGRVSQTATNTQVLEAQSQELIGAIQKQYGTNPSNVDFRAAASRVPTGAMSPEARQELVTLMRRGLEREAATTPIVMEQLQRGVTLQEAREYANAVYDARRSQGNPTQAGGSAAPQPPAAAAPAPQDQSPMAPPPQPGGPAAGGQIRPGNVVAEAQAAPRQAGATGGWGAEEPAPVAPMQPVHAPINPADLLNREPRDAYEMKMKDAMDRAKREADPQLWEMVVGAIQKGIELPQNLMSPQGGAGTVDAYKNLYRGAKQLLTNQYDPAEEQKIRAEQEAKMRDPRYAAGMHFSSVANPTSLIGGGSAGVLKNAASAFAQSMLQPEESLGDKFNQTASPTVLAATLAAAGKALPKTALPKTTPPGYLDAKDTFPGVRPTSAQLDEFGFGSNALGVNDARRVEQIKAISDTIRKSAGIEGNVVNQKVIDGGFKDTASKYDALFHDTRTPVGTTMTTADQASLRTKFQGMLNPGGDPTQATIGLNKIFNDSSVPALNRLRQVLETGATGTIKVNPADLQRAWREVGTIADVNPQAASQVRGFLEELVGKALSPQKLKEFKDLNHRWATLEDVQRIYHMGGEGKGTMSGDFAPSKLEALMGKGPNPGGVVDQAGHMVKGLRISDANPTELADSVGGILKQGVQRILGPVQSRLDRSAYNASPTSKHLIELLRAGLVRGLPSSVVQSGSTD